MPLEQREVGFTLREFTDGASGRLRHRSSGREAERHASSVGMIGNRGDNGDGQVKRQAQKPQLAILDRDQVP